MIATALALMIASAGPQTYGLRGADYAAAQGSSGGMHQTLALATRSYTLTSSRTGATLPILLPLNSLAVFQAVAAGSATCILAMSSSVTISGPALAAGACNANDPSGRDGSDTACFDVILSGGTIDQVPKLLTLQRKVGARTGGICTRRAAALDGEMVLVPCAVDGDCTDAGAGSTCDTTLSDQERNAFAAEGSAMVVCHASAANTILHVRVER